MDTKNENISSELQSRFQITKHDFLIESISSEYKEHEINVQITCFDVNHNLFVFGSNVGLVFCFRRGLVLKDAQFKFNLNEHVNINNIRFINDHLVAIATARNIYIFDLNSKSIQTTWQFNQDGVITYLYGQEDLDGILIGDSNGKVHIVNINTKISKTVYEETQLQSESHRHHIVQINWLSDHKIIVSSCFRSCIVDINNPQLNAIQIGQNTRKKCGNYGAVFINGYLYAARPSFHIIKADPFKGSVVETFILKKSTQPSSHPAFIEFKDDNHLNSKTNSQLGLATSFSSALLPSSHAIISWSSNTFIILTLNSELIFKETKLENILDIKISSSDVLSDIFILFSCKNIIRMRISKNDGTLETKTRNDCETYSNHSLSLGVLKHPFFEQIATDLCNFLNYPNNILKDEFERFQIFKREAKEAKMLAQKLHENLSVNSSEKSEVMNHKLDEEVTINPVENGATKLQNEASNELLVEDINKSFNNLENDLNTSIVIPRMKKKYKQKVENTDSSAGTSLSSSLSTHSSHSVNDVHIERESYSKKNVILSKIDSLILPNLIDADVNEEEDEETKFLKILDMYKKLSSKSVHESVDLIPSSHIPQSSSSNDLNPIHEEPNQIKHFEKEESAFTVNKVTEIFNEEISCDSTKDLRPETLIYKSEPASINLVSPSWDLVASGVNNDEMKIDQLCASGYNDVLGEGFVWLTYCLNNKNFLYILPNFGQVTLPSSDKIAVIAAGTTSIIIVYENGKMYCKDKIDPVKPLKSKWYKINTLQIQNRIVSISINTKDQVAWCCDESGSVWIFKILQKKLIPIRESSEDAHKFKIISVSPQNSCLVWGVDYDGKIYMREGIFNDDGAEDYLISGLGWILVDSPTPATSITVSKSSVYYFKDEKNLLYSRHINPNEDMIGTKWTKINLPTMIDERIKTISCSFNDDFWLLTTGSSLWRFLNGNCDRKFEEVESDWLLLNSA